MLKFLEKFTRKSIFQAVQFDGDRNSVNFKYFSICAIRFSVVIILKGVTYCLFIQYPRYESIIGKGVK